MPKDGVVPHAVVSKAIDGMSMPAAWRVLEADIRRNGEAHGYHASQLCPDRSRQAPAQGNTGKSRRCHGHYTETDGVLRWLCHGNKVTGLELTSVITIITVNEDDIGNSTSIKRIPIRCGPQ